MTEIPPFFLFLRDALVRYQRFLIWILFLAGVGWLMLAVPEVTTLLALSYVLALLIDPLVLRFERLGFSRLVGILAVYVLFLFVVVLFVFLVVPPLVAQGISLSENVPRYIERISGQLNELLERHFGMTSREAVDALWTEAETRLRGITTEGIRPVFSALGSTLLHGYSLTLTFVNLFLLPFFVFYITKDLDVIHRFISQFLTPPARAQAEKLGGEVLKIVQAFLRGQLVVCGASAFLYATLLTLAGLQSGFAIGLVTGVLNFVPFLGTVVGFTLTTVIAVATAPHWLGVFLAWGAFALANGITDNFIAPKVMSDELGLHPLGVLLAIIIGGNLLGLLGIVVAIPVAAVLRVLFSQFVFPCGSRGTRTEEEVEK